MRFPLSAPSPSLQNLWISQIQTQDSTGYEIFEAKIIPISPDASLVLTFYFEEKEFKVLRVLWIPEKGDPQTLAQNLSEGTLLKNQRTVLIPHSLLSDLGGKLLIQSDQMTLDLQALQFQWAKPALLVSSSSLSNEPHLLTPEGLLLSNEINGQALPLKNDSIQETISTTALVTQAENIDLASTYGIELTEVPTRARLEIEVQGLPVDEPLQVKLNDLDLGALPLETPSLRQTGYLSYQSTYWGWRKGSLWIPSSKLKSGLNRLQLSTPSNRTISIKNMILESDYRPPVSP
ncbi:MAG: hypothetical protein V4507_01255 [Verrucomicrobiota bacterium]